MPQIINTNIASINAQRNLDTSQKDNMTALQRLSSGLRINSARDDAAGMAISTRFTTQVEGLKVGIRNAGDGVSLAQTAEGALGAMTSALQRMRELALQSANATNSDIDRVALNAEVFQLKSEIDRIAEKTNFNGTRLLDGSFTDVTFQVGANEGESLSFSVNEVSGSTLGIGQDAGLSSFSTSDSLIKGDLIINGISIDSSRAADDTASVDNAAGSAIAKAAAINKKTEETGVVATVNTNTASGTNMVGAAAASGQITINNIVIDVNTGGLDLASDRASVVAAINANSDQTGVVAIDSGDDATGVILEAEDGRNIVVDSKASPPPLAGTTSYTAGGAGPDFSAGGAGLDYELNLTLSDGSTVNVDPAANATDFGGSTIEAAITAIQTALDTALGVAGQTAGDVTLSLDANGNLAFNDTTGSITSIQFDNQAGTGGTTTGLGLIDLQTSTSTSTGLATGTINSLGLANDGTYEGTLTLSSVNGEDIDIAQGSGDVQKSGFIAGTYAARTSIMNSNIQEAGSTFAWSGETDFSGGNATTFDLTFGGDTGQVALAADLTSSATISTVVSAINTAIGSTDLTGKIEAYEVEGKTNIISFRSLSNEPDASITVTSVLGGTAQNAANFFGMPVDGESTTSNAAKPALASGDLVINGVQIPAAKSSDDTASDDTYNSSIKAASGIATAAAINKATDETGVTAEVNPTTVLGTQGTAGTAGQAGQLYINGVDIGTFTASDNQELDKSSAISQINLFTGQTGVSAEDNGSGITLTAADGRNIAMAWNTDSDNDASGTGTTLSAAHFGISGAGETDFDPDDNSATAPTFTAAMVAKTTYSTVQLSAAGPIEVAPGSNGTQALYNLGFDAGTFGGSEGGQLIKDIDVSSVEGALEALDGIDNALDQINLERAKLGAVQNRFESTISNQAITAENFEAANSRIRDADFAAETAELSRTQVLQSAGLSILAQANGQPQQVLQLLQG